MTDASYFSIDNNEFVVGQKGFYEILLFDSYQSSSSNTSLWFRKTMISDWSTENRKVVDLNNTGNTWRPLSILFSQRLTPSTDRHTFFYQKCSIGWSKL